LQSDIALVKQIAAEISAQFPRVQRKTPALKSTEGRPRRYYWSEKSDSAEVEAVEGTTNAPTTDDNTLKELRMLFAAHGIGCIKLDIDNPAESQVLIPARERDEIDWDMLNRLATENQDFLAYVKLIRQFYQTGEARVADWDVPGRKMA